MELRLNPRPSLEALLAQIRMVYIKRGPVANSGSGMASREGGREDLVSIVRIVVTVLSPLLFKDRGDVVALRSSSGPS